MNRHHRLSGESDFLKLMYDRKVLLVIDQSERIIYKFIALSLLGAINITASNSFDI